MKKYIFKKIALTGSLAVLFGAGLALSKDIKYEKRIPISKTTLETDNYNDIPIDYVIKGDYAVKVVEEPAYKLLIKKLFD